jgi:hypothetical protein
MAIMANYLTLPLEIRQQILTYAFREAALQDIKFNKFQYRLYLELTSKQRVNQTYCATIDTINTPNLFDLAAKLTSMDEQLETDIIYPLDCALAGFDNLDEGDHMCLLGRMFERRGCLLLRFDEVLPSASSIGDRLWEMDMSDGQKVKWNFRYIRARWLRVRAKMAN